MSCCYPKRAKTNIWGIQGSSAPPCKQVCERGSLAFRAKVKPALLLPASIRDRHVSCGVQEQHVPPRWPGQSHRPGRTGQSSDFASWMKEKGLVPTSTDRWRVLCHVCVGLQGEPRRCCPHRKPPPRCGEPRVRSQGIFLRAWAWQNSPRRLGTFRRVQPKYLYCR